MTGRLSESDAPARRRGGGRAARVSQRAAGPKAAAVGPGLLGGAYRPLSDRDIQRIHERALDVLEKIGMGGAFPAFRELALAKGCWMNAHDRLCFPRSLIEDIVAGAARNFTLCGRDPAHDLFLADARTHFGTAGMAVKVYEPETRSYRSSTLVDLYDFARLVDRLSNVHWFSRTVVATELSDLFEFDMSVAYACAAGTRKHIHSGFNHWEHVADGIAMFDAMLGGEGRFRERPFCTANTCSIVPPLRYGEDNGAVSMECARRGMPVNMIIAAQAGATAPAALAGTLVQTVAETLAGLALVNLTVPGHPMIFSNWPFVSDLRTGSFSGGGGEEALLNAASAQITNFYDLPSGVAAGMSDSKMPDNQAGYEKGITTVLAGLAGANMVFESAGMLASLMACSFESLVIDNDMLGAVQRAVRGIEVTEETLSYEVLERVCCGGPGHFLGDDQTLSIMESEYQYPEVGDRSAADQWVEDGASDIRERAREKARAILSSHYPVYIDPKIDAEIRARYPIRLPREAMRPESGRW
ncbi:MAG: trimethylamine methyltransferase family protein [Myxococcales bacterium]|nr:trimethylamine methyltransferase family protein [Myxococcales bacterium]